VKRKLASVQYFVKHFYLTKHNQDFVFLQQFQK
jgi:hypothetical protein